MASVLSIESPSPGFPPERQHDEPTTDSSCERHCSRGRDDGARFQCPSSIGCHRVPASHRVPKQNYTGFLLRLPAAKTGIALLQRYKSLEATSNILKHIPLPSPRITRQISSLYNQETRVYSNLQKNINALVASQGVLERQYLTLETQKERCYRRVRSHWLKG